MCGIFGYFDLNRKTLSLELLKEMGKVIEHRGPDDYGLYHDQKRAVALGNRRLSILDIEHGHQPFTSDDNNIVVVQNGEIFNHVELARDLAKDGIFCKTHSDTEVILRLYERDGISGISKFNGMFAIAIYDKKLNALFLIRDRVGEKPLFFFENNGMIVFASEIKAILKVLGKVRVNFDALNQFLAFNYVPPPATMFAGIKHVLPGHYMKITPAGIEEKCWWDLAEVQVKNKSESEWIEEFNYVLDEAVKIRLRSDVPFGAFLSGGVDSSTIVGTMSHHVNSPVNTFCIGFNDPKYDESIFAQEAAERFNTNHTMRKIESNQMKLWELTTYYAEQPHGDVSFIPTYKVASLAAEKVKVVLTGDGADELFAGYDKYKSFFNNKEKFLSENEFKVKYFEHIGLFGPEKRNKLYSCDLQRLDMRDPFELVEPLYDKAKHMDRLNQALYLDTMLLLSGNNLVKPDRMGMAVSIENRSPFLDYRMVELAFAMPGNLKLHNGETKYIYKKAVSPLIGDNLAYRKKQMFTVPIGDWFKTDLKGMAQDLLLSKRSVNRNIFDSQLIKGMFEEHCSGKSNYTRELRALMAVEVWFRRSENNLL